MVWGKSEKSIIILFPWRGCFFPIRFTSYGILHHMAMHEFPHQFLIVWENAAKLIVWGENEKLVLILFPYYGRIFSIRFPFYSILSHMENACVFSLVSLNLGKDSQNHRMGKVWEIDSQKYSTKPVVCGEPEKLVLNLSHSMGASFFLLDSHSMAYFIICEINGFPLPFPMGKCSEIRRIGRAQRIGTHFFPNLRILFFHQTPILWYILLRMVFPIKIHSASSLVVFPQYYFFYLFQNLLIP